MYQAFFGLQKSPFNMTPDPSCLFLTQQHREALAGLMYAILDQKGFLVLTGDAGTGKTTLLAKTIQSLPSSRIKSSVILNPTLSTSEFLELALLDFGIQDVPVSKAQRIARFQRFLLDGHRSGQISVLVVDEAHKLSTEVLEEIRLLGNFEHADHKLIQILLIGQNELGDMLDREDLRQLKQRIALRFSIRPLALLEVEQYIRFRWSKAGGGDIPFTAESIAAISDGSRGIPRVINGLCDNVLTLAFGAGTQIVTLAHVKEACADLHLGSTLPTPATPVRVDPLQVSPNYSLELHPMRTLERYNAPPKPSLMARWAGKLGLAPKVESI
jgi:general secretion pathway protein A